MRRALPERPTVLAMLAAAASGVLYGACYPTWSLQWVAWLALVPLFVAARWVPRTSALALGWVWTIAAAATLGDWFPTAIANYYRQPLAVGLGFFFGVSTLLAAPYYVAFVAWYRRAARVGGVAAPLVTAAAWVAAEILRARIVGANPWALFGYSQVGRDALLQIADVTGIYGVGFVLVAVNAAVAEVVVAWHERRPRPLGSVLVAATAALALPAYAAIRTTTLPADAAAPVRVGVVQGNVDVGTQWNESAYGTNLDVYLGLTRDLLRHDAPPLVVWPENGLTFFLEDEPAYRAAIARVLAPTGSELLVGGPRVERDGTAFAYHNSMFLLDAAGAIRARYDKQHLVPFGERFPIPRLAGLARRFERLRELAPGPWAAPVATAAGVAGIMICSEAMFPELAAARVREGAAFFVDPAHDTWLTPKFSAQQFDIVRVRTIEQRRWLARASTSGPSAIVDPRGRVVEQSAFFTRAALSGTVRPRHDVTIYQRVGDLFAAACGFVAAAGGTVAALARRRRTD